MYEELLNQLLYYNSDERLYDKFNKMIYAYKLDIPVLMINSNSKIKFFTISIDTFDKSDNFENYRPIRLWMDSLNSDTIDENFKFLKGPTYDVSMSKFHYCVPYYRTYRTNYTCNECLTQLKILKYGIIDLKSPIILNYHKVRIGFHKLDFTWYTIDNNSLIIWYNYNNYKERIIFEFFEEVSDFPIEMYHEYGYQLTNEFECNICGELYNPHNYKNKNNDNNDQSDESENVLCNSCREILKQKFKIQLVPLIMMLNNIEGINQDCRSHIKKFFI